jgi:aldehyde:ferredoxin oxidoreductase
MLNLATGWNTTPDELRATARRIVTAKKHFNILCGWRPDEDTLPSRFLSQPLPDDPDARLTPDRLQQLVTAYNAARGWTPDGYPTAAQIAALDPPR